MPRALTAHNAVIKTASVSIRTLTIEGRQVTLAVFRQLIEEDIFDPDARILRGVGWGHVRYLIEEPPEEAINLVWQRGDELRRCILKRWPTPAWSPEHEAHLLDHAVHQLPGSGPDIYIAKGWVETAWHDLRVDAPPEITLPHPSYTFHDPEKLENERVLAEFKELAQARLRPMLREAAGIYEAYEQLVVPHFDLPQLFIAV